MAPARISGGRVVGKTPLILAPLIVGGALLFLSFWLGRWFERGAQRYLSSFINPTLHSDLVEVIRRALHPTDTDQVAYLPPALKEDAEKLLKLADAATDKRRREELRRSL